MAENRSLPVAALILTAAAQARSPASVGPTQQMALSSHCLRLLADIRELHRCAVIAETRGLITTVLIHR